MNGWFDDFNSLYNMYDNEEPTLKVGNYMYCVQQYGTKANPRKLHVSITDLSKVPDGEDRYSEKFEIENIDFENCFEFINNFKLKNGKTVAQMMCDANGWDYSILPVYPDWMSPLGELENKHISSDEEILEAERRAAIISKEEWEKEKSELESEGDTAGLRLFEEAEKEYPDDDSK